MIVHRALLREFVQQSPTVLHYLAARPITSVRAVRGDAWYCSVRLAERSWLNGIHPVTSIHTRELGKSLSVTIFYPLGSAMSMRYLVTHSTYRR
jgi:hypothetical protein